MNVRRQHTHRIYKYVSQQLETGRHRYFDIWNSLPEEVVTAPSVQAFEARLDKAWNNQPLKCHYKEDFVL